MGILIADSGATKTDWVLIDGNGNPQEFQSEGINPFFRTTDSIFNELKEKLAPQIEGSVEEIYFYGAGIVNQQKGDIIRFALNRLFPKAMVETHSDLLGAARALFGRQSGISCIMGTGSNTALYDGGRIVAGVPSLGFILGDECSGAVLGKKLISDYFKNVMPTEIQSLLENRYDFTQAEVLDRVYREERPNMFLASFVPFLSEYIERPYCSNLIENSLSEFFERNVMKVPNANEFALGFVGSVGFVFHSFIEKYAIKYGFKEPIILKSPISGLAAFHTKIDD